LRHAAPQEAWPRRHGTSQFLSLQHRDEVDVFIAMLHKAKKFFGACPTGRAMGY